MNVSLRAVRPDDRGFLLEVYASTRRAELELVDWPDEVKDAFVRQQFEAQDRYYRETYTAVSFDVIEHEGTPIGRLYVARWDEEIRVVDIALLPAFTGQGIGEWLLRDVLAEGAASGRCVTISVERFNPAQRLYRRLGFTDVAGDDVYLQLEWRPDR